MFKHSNCSSLKLILPIDLFYIQQYITYNMGQSDILSQYIRILTPYPQQTLTYIYNDYRIRIFVKSIHITIHTTASKALLYDYYQFIIRGSKENVLERSKSTLDV